MIYGDRIRQVRELHRMTQADLVSEIHGLTQPRLSRIEKDLAPVDAELAGMIAASCGVSPSFFEVPPPIGIRALSPQFRSRTRLTQGDKVAALRWADLVLEQYSRILVEVESIPIQLPRFRNARPRDAAAEMRRLLGFDPNAPLPYLLLAIERLGVLAAGLPMQLPTMDAFSAWNEDVPIICALRGAAGDRLRFSIAHELGHLILHEPGERRDNLESEADEFASELLMPAEMAVRVIPRNATLASLVMLKGQWGVSVKSLVYRARALSIFPEERCVSLYKQISSRGWNKSEPGYVPVEKPRGFRRVVESVYGPGPNVDRFAADANWSHALAIDVLGEHASADELPFEGATASPAGELGWQESGQVLPLRRSV